MEKLFFVFQMEMEVLKLLFFLFEWKKKYFNVEHSGAKHQQLAYRIESDLLGKRTGNNLLNTRQDRKEMIAKGKIMCDNCKMGNGK